MVVNTGFATAHPTAVEDFLRADLEGFLWGDAHQAQAVKDCQARLDPKLYITPGDSAFRWRVEAGIVVSSTPRGTPIGGIDFALIAREYAEDVRLNLVPAGVDLHKAFNASFVNSIYDGTTLIWPAKFA
jgi:NitT/TauT family transport system substrate-binding protein